MTTETPFGNKVAKISIQTKLSALIFFTATLIFSGYGFYNYITVRSAMKVELHALSDFWAKQLAESLKMPLWQFNEESVNGIVNSTMLEKQMYAVVVTDDKGKVLYGLLRDNNWNIVETKQELPENEYVKKKDILQENNKIGSVEVCFSHIFMQKKLTEDTVKMLITVIILNIALVCSLVIGVRRGIVLPVRRIAGSVRIIASGELDTEVRNERNDEIGQLASDVDRMRSAIKDMTESLKEQERLKSEMELARKIQTVLLPKNPVISGYEIAASMQPSEEVGGDYYDVISAGGYDWIVIGDVSGHGVTSGLVMMMVQTSIHTVLIRNPETLPSHLLSVINRTIYENLVLMDEQKHMTIIVIACGQEGFFDFSGLHEDILLWRSETGKVEKIETDGMWIGLEADISEMLPLSEFRMGNGDCIVLYTDGIIEARGKDGSFFGEERLIKLIEQFGDKCASEIHADILKALKPYEKPDDVTLFVMKRVSG
jgi:serine phosphatase RsbU (regulator of sigma subunit)